MSPKFAGLTAFAAAFLLVGACYAAAPTSEEEKTIYAIGVAMSQSLARYSLSDADIELVKQGLSDGLKDTATVDVREQSANIQKLARDRAKIIAEAEGKESAKFIEMMAAKPGAEKHPQPVNAIDRQASNRFNVQTSYYQRFDSR